jgi:hypothetical protein
LVLQLACGSPRVRPGEERKAALTQKVIAAGAVEGGTAAGRDRRARETKLFNEG